MKNSSFASLVYREYAICAKSLGIYAITSLLFTMFPILIALSLRFGNLTMLPDAIVSDIRADHDIMLKLFAVIAPCMLCLSVAESSIYDSRAQWDRFRRSTPISPARMALAKYVFLAIMLGVSFMAALAAVGIFAVCMDIAITKTDIGIILLLITAICIMSILAQFFIMLFRSVDKGMLAMIAVLATPILLIEKQLFGMTVERLLNFADKYLPLFPVILGIALVIGFALTTLLYKRREK